MSPGEEGSGPPAEAAADADAEEKKRKRAEDAEDGTEQTKKQKSQEKEETDAATAEEEPDAVTAPGGERRAGRGERGGAGARRGIKDPPCIFPHVQTLYNAFWDPSKSAQVLRETLQQVIETRKAILAETEEIAQMENVHPNARRRALCKVIYDRLNCAQGQAPVCQLTADPTVRVLRRGGCKTMKQFVDNHKDWFVFGEGESSNGKKQPMLFLSPGRQTYQGPPMDEATLQYRTEMLLFRTGELLEKNLLDNDEGSLPVSKIAQDVAVRELKKGMPYTVVQLLRKHTEYFTLEETEITTQIDTKKQVLMCTMVERPPEPAPMPEPDPAAEGEDAEAAQGEESQCPPWASAWMGMMQDWWSSWPEEDTTAQEGEPDAGGTPALTQYEADAALDAAGAAAAAALAGMGDLFEGVAPPQVPKQGPAATKGLTKGGPAVTLAAPMQVGPQIMRG